MKPTSIALLCLAIHAGALADDWPQFAGPSRNGHSAETSGWGDDWAPKRLWTKKVGRGCTSPIIVDGKVYVMGWEGPGRARGNTKGKDVLRCLDLRTGEQLWAVEDRERYQGRTAKGDTGQYGGPNATPAYDADTGYIYTLSVDGKLIARDTKQRGRVVWGRSMFERALKYNIPQRPNVGGGLRDFGFTASPLIYGDWVIIEVGAKQGTLVAFDKRKGTEAWRSQFNQPAGHSPGPVVMSTERGDVLALLALKQLVVIDLAGKPGRTIAEHPWATDYACNIPQPAVTDAGLVLTSGYNHKQVRRLSLTGEKLNADWTARAYATVAPPVVVDGKVFLLDRSMYCVNVDSGKVHWRGGRYDHGSMIATADGKILALARGTLTLVDAEAGGHRELARIDKLVPGTCYPHLALADGIVLCKDREGNLTAVKLKRD